MTSLRERLERKIERYANSIYPPIDPRWAGTENEAFKDGADMMLDFVCELAEALEKYSHELSHGFCAREALQAIEKFVEGEK